MFSESDFKVIIIKMPKYILKIVSNVYYVMGKLSETKKPIKRIKWKEMLNLKYIINKEVTDEF